MKSKLFRVFSIVMIISMLVMPVSAKPIEVDTGPIGFEAVEAQPVYYWPAANGKVINEIKGAEGLARYIVLLREASLATYEGGVKDFAPTSPSAIGAAKLDVASPASQAYLGYLEAQQAAFVNAIETQFGRPVKVVAQYLNVLNGLAVELTPEEAAEVAKLSNVRLVERDVDMVVDTDYGPAWIGAPEVWVSPGIGSEIYGEGIVAGILDTGINADHPSFADIGGDGYDHTNPRGKFYGVCDIASGVYTDTFTCNDKLIGAWEYTYPLVVGQADTLEYPTPEDDNGHGSHTASTTAGNFVDAEVVYPTYSYTGTISGVAPHAAVIAYDICYTRVSDGAGLCPTVASVAAINQAAADQVDVINFSIGGGTDPYASSTELAFLEAVKAGVFVSTSAGNSGTSGINTLGHLGPWVSTTAASTHNRKLVNALTDMTGGNTAAPADITGNGITGGYGPAKIVYSGDYVVAPATAEDAQLCAPGAFPAGTFNGEIVVCDRGIYARVDKAISVRDGGAGGYVLANDAANGASLASDGYVIPGVHITYDDGVTLKTWLADGATNHMATIRGAIKDTNVSNGDILAGFSSIGPGSADAELNVIKPSSSAPGVAILAAVNTPDLANPGPAEFDFYEGTSMASPHNAGAAALLKALHPTWTPIQIMSALMTTSTPDVMDRTNTRAANYFEMGAGRIQVDQAVMAGLVMNETYAHFVAADPASGGDPATLNLPSLKQNQCLVDCGWTRVFSSTVPVSTKWNVTVSAPPSMTVVVSPTTFVVVPYGTQTLEVSVNVEALDIDVWAFAELVLTEDSSHIFLPIIFGGGGRSSADAASAGPQLSYPDQRIPIAVKPVAGVIPKQVTIETRRDVGSYLLEGLQAREITDFTSRVFGLEKATLTTEMLNVDPTNSDAYDNLNDGTTFFITTTVTASDLRLVAEIVYSDAPDIDMYVGLDDGDGIPEASEEVCVSATGTALEYCSIDMPAAGVYWILVQNWEESTAAPDKVILASAVVAPADLGNLTLMGPSGAVTQLDPFDLTLAYDLGGAAENDRFYGGFSLGTDAAHPDNVAPLVPVDIRRLADDVTKTATTDTAALGDVVTYTITIEPNVTGTNLTYLITDTLPAGMTYVPGSATGNPTVNGNQLVWTVDMTAEGYYAMSTSDTDPACAVPLANRGAYLNLAAFGVAPQSAVTGDTVTYRAFSTGDPFDFFGVVQSGGALFTDDGFAFFNSTPSTSPWTNRDIPDARDPNNLMAVLWNDFEIVYDAAKNQGVSIATLGGATGAAVIEYDDLQVYGEPSQTLDLELFIWRHAGAGPEIIFAYDNISITLERTGTIGVENALGTKGIKFAYNDAALDTLQDGMAICFDWTFPEAKQLTYAAQATVVGAQTNAVESITDDPYAAVTTTSVTVDVIEDLTTFTYYDLEDVVAMGEDVYVAGSFNSWNASALMMEANADYSVFEVTTSISPGAYEYKYVVKSNGDQWEWLNTSNRNLIVAAGDALAPTAGHTYVEDYRKVSVGYAHLIEPDMITIVVSSTTGIITGEVWIQNVTKGAGAGLGILPQVGFGTGSDLSTWTWYDMTYASENGENDIYTGHFTPTVTGTFSYTVAFDGNWGVGNPNAGFTFGDLDGVHPGKPFDLSKTGVLTVNPVTP